MSAATPNDAHHTWISAYPVEVPGNLLGVRLAASTTSSKAQLVGNGNCLVLTNPGGLGSAVEVYVALGGSTVVATTSHFPVLPGVQTIISLPDDGTGTISSGLWIAVITASSTGVLLAHLGFGN